MGAYLEEQKLHLELTTHTFGFNGYQRVKLNNCKVIKRRYEIIRIISNEGL